MKMVLGSITIGFRCSRLLNRIEMPKATNLKIISYKFGLGLWKSANLTYWYFKMSIPFAGCAATKIFSNYHFHRFKYPNRVINLVMTMTCGLPQQQLYYLLAWEPHHAPTFVSAVSTIDWPRVRLGAHSLNLFLRISNRKQLVDYTVLFCFMYNI